MYLIGISLFLRGVVMADRVPLDPDFLEVLDDMLTAALKELRRARARQPASPTTPASTGKRTSQPAICIDVLTAAGRPLHVSALIEALHAHGVQANRDSLVSALSKRLAPHGPFVRTAANTFGLNGRDLGEN